MRHSVVARSR